MNMSDPEQEKETSELVSRIAGQAAHLLERIDEIEARDGPTPELEPLKAALQARKQLRAGMAADEIRLLLIRAEGGAQ